MVNTGTVAAGGVQPREIRDVPGSEIMGISIIGLRGLRISWWMLPPFVSLLRIWPDIITGKSKRRKKNYAPTCVRCVSRCDTVFRRIFMNSWDAREFETNFRTGKRRDRDGYGNCWLYRAGREYNSFRSYVTWFHFALDYLQRCSSILSYMDTIFLPFGFQTTCSFHPIDSQTIDFRR